MTTHPDLAAERSECWGWGLVLADGEDPGLIDASGILDRPVWEADCDEPHAYEVWLDKTVWAEGYTILCVEHTAKLRALPHGGIVRITDSSAGAR